MIAPDTIATIVSWYFLALEYAVVFDIACWIALGTWAGLKLRRRAGAA